MTTPIITTNFSIPKKLVSDLPVVKSESFETTFTGLPNVNASATLLLSKVGKDATIVFPDPILVSASGATPVLTSTQLPYAYRPKSDQSISAVVLDNVSGAIGGYINVNQSGIITINAVNGFQGTGSSGLGVGGVVLKYDTLHC